MGTECLQSVVMHFCFRNLQICDLCQLIPNTDIRTILNSQIFVKLNFVLRGHVEVASGR